LIDSVGGVGVDVVLELLEMGYGVVISAAKAEDEGVKELGFLDAKFLK